jgi:hypothetical protein
LKQDGDLNVSIQACCEQSKIREISGSHGSEYEEYSFLGCSTMTSTWRQQHGRWVGVIRINLNIELIKVNCDQSIMYGDSLKLSDLRSDKNLLEFILDYDELQELCIMATRPHVRNITSSIVSKLKVILGSAQWGLKEFQKTEKKWSDVVAERYIWN